jgi:hypothetical protein
MNEKKEIVLFYVIRVKNIVFAKNVINVTGATNMLNMIPNICINIIIYNKIFTNHLI